MAIGEQVPKTVWRELKEVGQVGKVGWSKATVLAKLARREGQQFDCAKWLHKARTL